MAKLDLTCNTPENKTQLTKENMFDYVSKKEDVADLEWFINLLEANKKYKTNNLTGKTVEGYDLSKIREEFAQKYFYSISTKAKKESKSKTKKLSFEDKIAAAKKRIEEAKSEEAK